MLNNFSIADKYMQSYKIGSSLQLIRAIYRQFCCWHFRQTAARNVRHSVQISCNFRRNVQSVDKRDVLVTLTPPPPPPHLT